MSKITLTVLITSYNRPQFLKRAIKSVLNQTFNNFELLILDDASSKKVDQTVTNFKDRRIIFIKNKKNIGYAANLKNGFQKAKGKYIFILSDDDIILHQDTFSTMVREMDKKKAGYAQTGLVYYDISPDKPSVITHIASRIIYLPPTKDILIKTIDWHYGFMSGNMFRREFIDIENDLLDNDIWWPYLKAVYKALVNHGGVYFGNHFIIARTSTTGLISYIDMKKNKSFYLDLLFKIYQEFDKSKIRLAFFKKKRLDFVISTLPGIKYYTSNTNIISMAKSIIKHHPSYQNSLYFWIFFIVSLISPKPLLRIIKMMRSLIGYYRLIRLSQEINLVKNLSKLQ